MTGDTGGSDSGVDRSTTRKGLLATGGLALASAGVGTGGAQVADDENVFVEDEPLDAAMFSTAYRPGARFIIVSPVLDWTPDVQADIAGEFAAYNTRILQYVDTNEQVIFFQAEAAEVPPYDEDAGYVLDDDEAEEAAVDARGNAGVTEGPLDSDVGEAEGGLGESPEPELYTFGTGAVVFGGENRQGLLGVTAYPLEEDVERDVLGIGGNAGLAEDETEPRAGPFGDNYQDQDDNDDEGAQLF